MGPGAKQEGVMGRAVRRFALASEGVELQNFCGVMS